jgi:hypothetical protein
MAYNDPSRRSRALVVVESASVNAEPLTDARATSAVVLEDAAARLLKIEIARTNNNRRKRAQRT